MYRQYENPVDVQKREDIDLPIDLYNEVEELRERVSYAWQDDEYDEIESMKRW